MTAISSFNSKCKRNMTLKAKPKFFEINKKTDIEYAFKKLENIETNILICGSGSTL